MFNGNLGVAQLVARYLGVVEAAGSSPVTQTHETQGNMRGSRVFLCLLFLSEYGNIYSQSTVFTQYLKLYAGAIL